MSQLNKVQDPRSDGPGIFRDMDPVARRNALRFRRRGFAQAPRLRYNEAVKTRREEMKGGVPMAHFKPGSCIRIGGEQILVDALLGSGGQADVYRVLNLDRKCFQAMKHLYGFYVDDRPTFYRKVQVLAKYRDQPLHPDLVWPEAVSELDETTESFCYLMELLLPGYENVAPIMKNPDRIPFAQRKELCIRLADIFSAIHGQGYIYTDISATNIFFCIDGDGGVRLKVIDCDNISLEGKSMGLKGTGLFRAPEILTERSLPTIQSDLHALAVAVFRMLVGCHPLEGSRTRSEAFTPENIVKFFGEEPEYIFSARGGNPPYRGEFTERFLELGEAMQMYFQLMFSPTRLAGNGKRPSAETLKLVLQQCRDRRN